jgi:hypothetical protein
VLYKLRNMMGWISRDYDTLWLVLAGIGVAIGFARSAARKKVALLVDVVGCQFLYYLTYRLSLPCMVLLLFARLSVFAGVGVGLLPHMLERYGPPGYLRTIVIAGLLSFLIGFGSWSAASRELIDYSEEDAPAAGFSKSVEAIPHGSPNGTTFATF